MSKVVMHSSADLGTGFSLMSRIIRMATVEAC